MDVFAKKTIQNTVIFILILIALKNLLIALPFDYDDKGNYVFFESHRLFLFLSGLLMLLLAYRVYKRVRIAWAVEIILLTATITSHLIHRNKLTLPMLIIEVLTLVVLILFYADFNRKLDRLTVRKALGLIGASIFLILINSTIGIFILKKHIINIHDILGAFQNSIKLLVFLDTQVLVFSGKNGQKYADFLITINWIFIISSAFLLLKPLIYNPIENIFDKDRVRSLVNRYGQNPLSYLALESDKKYFFGTNVEGVCAYQVVRNVFTICGDMICEKTEGFIFLNEILSFCKQNGYSIIFINVTDYFYELYSLAGLGLIKCGEDACFKFEEYNLSGGRVAKVRAAINHASKNGIEVREYKPLETRDSMIEQQISDITREWLKGKGGFEMGFTLGSTSLDDPLDRRYFYAVDSDGLIWGYVVFLPYDCGKAYMADITRRRSNAPQGVLEKITYEAFMKMKQEGFSTGNLGLSPLFNIADSENRTIIEKVFSYVYENINVSYDFKALHHAKEKYGPTEWKPRYIAYYPHVFTPNLAYALVRVQTGKKLTSMVISQIFKKRD